MALMGTRKVQQRALTRRNRKTNIKKKYKECPECLFGRQPNKEYIIGDGEPHLKKFKFKQESKLEGNSPKGSAVKPGPLKGGWSLMRGR